MLYPFTVITVDLYKNWLCFKLFKNISISCRSNNVYFAVFLKTSISAAMALRCALFLQCQRSTAVGSVGICNVLHVMVSGD